jgi:hypothetical protein
VIAIPVRRLLVVFLAILLVIAPVVHIAFMPVGKGSAVLAAERLASGDSGWSRCVNHRHGAQCAMSCYAGVIVAAPAIIAPTPAAAVEVVAAHAAPQSEVVPTARGPPRA